MKIRPLSKKSLTFFAIFLVIGASIIPTINSESNKPVNKKNESENDWLDSKYIFNISKNLSDIIFT